MPMEQVESKASSVLFICTGNICRSPMAAALLKHRRDEQGEFIVRSAGIRALDGQPAHPLAKDEMSRRGIDLTGHRARTITPNLLAKFDLILVMESEHREWIEERMVSVRGRVHLLGHWRGLEIADPLNGGRHAFELAAETMAQCLSDWSFYLQEEAGYVHT